jgi:hypothetical protein
MGVPALALGMFIRKKPNKNGIVSVQIIDHSSGNHKLVNTVGSSDNPEVVDTLMVLANQQLMELTGQQPINFEVEKQQELLNLFFNNINEVLLYGRE